MSLSHSVSQWSPWRMGSLWNEKVGKLSGAGKMAPLWESRGPAGSPDSVSRGSAVKQASGRYHWSAESELRLDWGSCRRPLYELRVS